MANLNKEINKIYREKADLNTKVERIDYLYSKLDVNQLVKRRNILENGQIASVENLMSMVISATFGVFVNDFFANIETFESRKSTILFSILITTLVITIIFKITVKLTRMLSNKYSEKRYLQELEVKIIDKRIQVYIKDFI